MARDPSWPSRVGSSADVVAHVRSGMRVFVHGAAATPVPLLDAREELRRVLFAVRHFS